MDFFARETKAKKISHILIAYFIVALVCIVACVYIVSVFLFHGAQTYSQTNPSTTEFVLWNPQLLLYSAIGTLSVVIIASLYKTAALKTGGDAVAESLGGRLLDPMSTDPDERRLRNVIEEMSIASGVPVPKIYVLDQGNGINAFAAGHSPQDAAIGVTRGCMVSLTRDELQGVLGHEFSHLLNGDMRLNLRIMGFIFGILCLAVIGRILLVSRGRSRDRNPLIYMGFALIIIGSIGVFFGRLIQAALSRQREYLADASSVQFTRNPAGLSGALQKIGARGSRIESPHTGEASHLFFANGLSDPFLRMLATHPPLEQRIRAIDPAWDGTFSGSKAVLPEATVTPIHGMGTTHIDGNTG